MKVHRSVTSLFITISLLFTSVGGAQTGGNSVNPDPRGNPASSPMREFVTACTYGVLAGTMVGTATLAFENKPGDSLQNVARGASIGLYLGILLGLYVVYIVPGQIEKEQMQLYENQGLPPPDSGIKSSWNIIPLVTQKGWEGAFAQYQVMTF